MPLRDYQDECADNIANEWNAGVSKQLAVAPTAAGKTVIFSHVPERIGLQPWDKVLVVAHRDELITQSADKFSKYNPDMLVDIEKAEYKADPNANVIVTSVQSLGVGSKRNENGDWIWAKRLQKFNPEDFKLIIIDEVHHAAKGDTYANILRYFRAYKPDPAFNDSNRLLLGFTATPRRPDGIGLETLFDKITFQRELRQMIDAGWLAKIKAWRVDTTVDLSEVETRMGDFAVNQLEKTVNTPARNKLIVDKYLEFGEGMRAAAFTVDVQHSVDLAAMFQQNGIPAYPISGSTPKDERRRILEAFRIGQIKVVCSCGVLTEGWDDPGVGCLLMARPTKSGLLYVQMVGRGLRPYPAPEELADIRQKQLQAMKLGEPIQKTWIKPYCIVIDFCDVSAKHELNTVPTLFGLRPDFKLSGKKLVNEQLDEIDKTLKNAKVPIQTEMYDSIEKLKSAAEAIDLLAKPELSAEAQKYSRLAWVTGMSGAYQIAAGESTFRIKRDTLGMFEVSENVKGVAKLIGRFNDGSLAFAAAEAKIPRDKIMMLSADAKWRYDKASVKQAEALWNMKSKGLASLKLGRSKEQFVEFITANYSKGDASALFESNKPVSRPPWLQKKIDSEKAKRAAREEAFKR